MRTSLTAIVTILTAINFAILTVLHRFWFEALNGGEKLFDARFTGYSVDVVNGVLDNLGEAGRAGHILWHNTIFDFSFPLILSACAVSWIVKLGNRLPRFKAMANGWKLLLSVIVVMPYLISDLAENGKVRQILENGAPAEPGLVASASALTVSKWAFVAITLSIVMLFTLAGSFAQRNSGRYPSQGDS